MRIALFLIFIFLDLLLQGCGTPNDSVIDERVNFKDTLFETKVIFADSSDTLKQYNKIYYTPTDFSIDTSNFYYTACKQPCSEGKGFKVFFNRQAVVGFCDSILNTIPKYKNQGDDVIFFERITYEHIRDQAIKNKMDNAIYVDELQILLDRFNPYIVSRENKDKPTYIINCLESSRNDEYKTYNFKSKTGDTIFLAIKDMRPAEIEMEEQ